jgi:hypothetical protein
MILCWLYFASIVGLLVAIGIAAVLGVRKRAFHPFTTLELATAAILICLLHVAIVPWQIGLAKVPGLDALVFSIPYTAIFLLGLRLVPKAGFATLLICGQGLFGQLLGRGINPAWWPYYLWCALGVEILLLLAGGRMKNLPVMLAVGSLRGLLAYTYMYLILAPFLWHQFYAPWYVAVKILMGLIGCVIGAVLAWQLAPAIEKATRQSSL